MTPLFRNMRSRCCSLTPEEINAKLTEQHCSALWIPAPDAYWKVDAIPMLGTGKTDYPAIAEIAKGR